MKDIAIVTATAKEKPEDTILWGSVQRLIKCGSLRTDGYRFYTSNDKNLAAIYNEAVWDPCFKNKIVILVHDDVRIDDMFIAEKLNTAIDSGVQVVALAGIAGAYKPYDNGFRTSPFADNRVPMMWHLMANRWSFRGEVSHFVKTPSGNGFDVPSYTTCFGPMGKVTFFDGVFMAIDVDNIPKNPMFDENCPSRFHFYDLNFSLNCIFNNVRSEVRPIRITHASPGAKHLDDEFWTGERYFRRKIEKVIGKLP